MKVRLWTFLMAVLVAQAALAIELVSPKEGEEFCGLQPEHRAFLALDREARRERFLDKEWRAHIVNDVSSTAVPLRLTWKGGKGPYDVKVLLGGRTVFETNVAGTAVNVWNLEIARDYSWTVSGGGESASGRFRTLDLAPRLMHVPNVKNIRDLGGRVGLDGRRIRQGLVYRSTGLNNNASTYFSCEETIAMYKAGVLEKRFGELGLKVKKQIERDKGEFKFDPKAPYLRNQLLKDEKDYRAGKTKMTPEGVHIATEVLGWKSDIDLRTDIECWGMKGSPAGEKVKWWHYSSLSYSGMATPKGKDAFAKVFRVFLDRQNYPLVFHCIGGADRTGAVGFILNALLGVCDEELDKDWEITCFIYESQNFGHKTRFDKLRKVFDAYPGKSTHEKVEAYVKEQGFTDADIATFREIMLERT